MGQTTEVESGIYRWSELPVKESAEREARKIMEGTSPYFDFLEMHATTQIKGARPSPAHTQEDIEEIIIVKEGTMKFTMNEEEAFLGPGSIILIPPLASQALQNVGDGPLTYYVIMFRAKKSMDIQRSEMAGGHLFVNADTLTFSENRKGGRWNYLDRPTAMCESLHIHATQLDQIGPSIDPHQHPETELFLIIEGETELSLDGQRIAGKAGDLYFVKPGQVHGMSNASEQPCRFFAIKWK